MKKIIALSMMLSIAASVFAQGTNKVSVTDSIFLDEFNINDVTVTGLNDDGSIIYGTNGSGSAVTYDFKNTNPLNIVTATDADYFGISVAGVTPERDILLSHYMFSYFYNLKDGSKVNIESPDENFGVDAWDISADGKYVGYNLTTSGYEVIPMVAEKQENGTYKLIYLEYDPYDAMGCTAQYTQVRFISDDGNYIMGIQPDNRGMGGRLVVWEKQADGSYKFTTPLDEYIYDLSVEKPGLAPEWSDYVTADYETERELFDQQSAEFDKIFKEYEDKYSKFTRNHSSLDIYRMNKSTRSNTICMAFYDNRVSQNMDLIPVYYNCETKKITEYPDMINSVGMDDLPGGGYIAVSEQGGLYSLTAIDEQGNKKPFETWFNEITGEDISKYFTFTFYDFMTDQEVSGVFPGLPYFSKDGKTLAFAGLNPELGKTTSIFRFDTDIFAMTTTDIKANVTDEIKFGNNKIMIGADKQGVADIYTLSGAKCGSYVVNGTFDFSNVLSKGAYIVKMNIEGQKPISTKIIVK